MSIPPLSVFPLAGHGPRPAADSGTTGSGGNNTGSQTPPSPPRPAATGWLGARTLLLIGASERLDGVESGLDGDLARTLRDGLAAGREVIRSVEAAVSDDDEQRRAAALEKVRMLKARLQTLRMTAANDPDGTAREAAHLARALASAVRAYISAGGSAAEIGGLPTATASAAPAESAEANADRPSPTEPPSLPAPDPATGGGADDGTALSLVREVRAMMVVLRDLLDHARDRAEAEGRRPDRAVADGREELRRLTGAVGALTAHAIVVVT